MLARLRGQVRIKVSLFLAEGMQHNNGKLVLPSPVTPTLGTVRYYAADGATVERSEQLFLPYIKVGCGRSPQPARAGTRRRRRRSVMLK